ncbi:hypothetical protein MIND_00991200 [Mycena indigotica]|uniref:DUF6534 domain-containing protein n=1 Tax=Mycena indigotica TaxID=2126181 RepID=A0A8H6S8X2_9AGAR|nr:uncharacterized protein MIND_00991200 [Mycena indigotica]KAF7294547.1 hypothetical protein MIND_00991200 [Mycena indigotica]
MAAAGAGATLPPNFNPAEPLGDLEIGVLVAYALFGITTAQAYTYYTRFPNDSVLTKLWVAFIWLCELAHIACIAQTLFTATIKDYMHPERLGGVSLSMLVSILLTGIIAALVQGFFGLRIYRLSRQPYIPFVIFLLALIQVAFSIIPFIGAQQIAQIVEQQSWVVYSELAVSAANDLIIAVTIVTHLWWEKNIANQSTTVVLEKIIMWTIETGIITSAAALLALILFATMPGSFGWLAVEVVVAKLYSNSLLASLNSRSTLRALRTDQTNTGSYTMQVSVSTNVEVSKHGKFGRGSVQYLSSESMDSKPCPHQSGFFP